MKRIVLLIVAVVFGMNLALPIYAQERRPQRRPPAEEQRQAVPRPPQQLRPYQRNYRSPRREREWGFYFHYDRPYYGYNSRRYYPRYYPRYYQRCIPDQRVFVGYDWYGYPVYDLIRGYCY